MGIIFFLGVIQEKIFTSSLGMSNEISIPQHLKKIISYHESNLHVIIERNVQLKSSSYSNNNSARNSIVEYDEDDDKGEKLVKGNSEKLDKEKENKQKHNTITLKQEEESSQVSTPDLKKGLSSKLPKSNLDSIGNQTGSRRVKNSATVAIVKNTVSEAMNILNMLEKDNREYREKGNDKDKDKERGGERNKSNNSNSSSQVNSQISGSGYQPQLLTMQVASHHVDVRSGLPTQSGGGGGMSQGHGQGGLSGLSGFGQGHRSSGLTTQNKVANYNDEEKTPLKVFNVDDDDDDFNMNNIKLNNKLNKLEVESDQELEFKEEIKHSFSQSQNNKNSYIYQYDSEEKDNPFETLKRKKEKAAKLSVIDNDLLTTKREKSTALSFIDSKHSDDGFIPTVHKTQIFQKWLNLHVNDN